MFGPSMRMTSANGELISIRVCEALKTVPGPSLAWVVQDFVDHLSNPNGRVFSDPEVFQLFIEESLASARRKAT